VSPSLAGDVIICGTLRDSHERRLVQSRTTSKSASRSPSLTPPPPSVLLKARELTGSPKREDRLSAVDDEEQDEDGEEGNDVNIVGEDASLSAKESLDSLDGPVKGVTDGDDDDVDADADDDGEGDGDITMRPVDEDEPEEADPVDGVNGDEEATGTTNGLPSVFVEDQDADADADADADEDQRETGPAEEEEEEHEAPGESSAPDPYHTARINGRYAQNANPDEITSEPCSPSYIGTYARSAHSRAQIRGAAG